MSNIASYFPLVNGDIWDLVEKGQPTRSFIHLVNEDFGAPQRSLNIEITTDSGKVVKVVIPYDNTKAIVMIDGDRVE